jgi:hypothetical protein
MTDRFHLPERACHRITVRSAPAEAKSGVRSAKASARTERGWDESETVSGGPERETVTLMCPSENPKACSFPKESVALQVREDHTLFPIDLLNFSLTNSRYTN